MPQYQEQTGRRKEVTLTPEITRAFWSKRRAWQGDQVKLFIETHQLKDGTPLKIEIWEDGADDQAPDGFITRLSGDYKVQRNRCTVDYTIKWDPASLPKALRLESKRFEFYFLAKTEKPPLKRKSNLMYVDLHPLIVSA